jgi:hypothetical protein
MTDSWLLISDFIFIHISVTIPQMKYDCDKNKKVFEIKSSLIFSKETDFSRRRNEVYSLILES